MWSTKRRDSGVKGGSNQLEVEALGLSNCMTTLEQHGKLLEELLAGQREVRERQAQLLDELAQQRSAAGSVKGKEKDEQHWHNAVLLALHKLDAKVSSSQRPIEPKADRESSSTLNDRRSSRKVEEAGLDVAAEFAGLWYDDKVKHVICGKFLHYGDVGDVGDTKVELEVHGRRSFSVAGDTHRHAQLNENGSKLIWDSGRVWTRSPVQPRSMARPSISFQQSSAEECVTAESGDPDTSISGGGAESEEVDIGRQLTAAKGVLTGVSDHPTKITSTLGDALRHHATFAGVTRPAMVKAAAFADWLEHQKRAPVQKKYYLDQFVQSVCFEILSALLILANAVYIGLKTNWFMRHPSVEPDTFPVDVFFVAFFSVELLLRLVSLGWRRFCFGPDAAWYCLDIVLIWISVVELFADTSNSSFSFLRIVRVFKLARVIRMVRTLRLFTDLRLLLDCMLGSLHSLLWCLIVIAFVFYLFALIIMQGLAAVVGDLEQEFKGSGEREQGTASDARSLPEPGSWDDGLPPREELGDFILERYGSVAKTMLRLWESATGGIDWVDEYDVISLAGSFHAAVFIIFIAVMIIVVWNIITSTIVEKALRYAAPDIDQMLWDKRQRDEEDVRLLVSLLYKAGFELKHKISLHEFQALLRERDFVDFLQLRGIDIKEAHSFFALFNEEGDGRGVDTMSFINMCLRIKGFATSIDLHTTHHQLVRLLKRSNRLIENLDSKIFGAQLTSEAVTQGSPATLWREEDFQAA